MPEDRAKRTPTAVATRRGRRRLSEQGEAARGTLEQLKKAIQVSDPDFPARATAAELEALVANL